MAQFYVTFDSFFFLDRKQQRECIPWSRVAMGDIHLLSCSQEDQVHCLQWKFDVLCRGVLGIWTYLHFNPHDEKSGEQVSLIDKLLSLLDKGLNVIYGFLFLYSWTTG